MLRLLSWNHFITHPSLKVEKGWAHGDVGLHVVDYWIVWLQVATLSVLYGRKNGTNWTMRIPVVEVNSLVWISKSSIWCDTFREILGVDVDILERHRAFSALSLCLKIHHWSSVHTKWYKTFFARSINASPISKKMPLSWQVPRRQSTDPSKLMSSTCRAQLGLFCKRMPLPVTRQPTKTIESSKCDIILCTINHDTDMIRICNHHLHAHAYALCVCDCRSCN